MAVPASKAQIYIGVCRQFAREQAQLVKGYLRTGGAPDGYIELIPRLVNNAILAECEENVRGNDIVAMNAHEFKMYPGKGANALFNRQAVVDGSRSTLEMLSAWEEEI